MQRVYLGNDRSPLTVVTWTTKGPQIASPRVHVAQATDEPTESLNIFQVPKLFPLAALVGLYNALQAKPDSLGAGSADVPVMAFKVWTGGGQQGIDMSVEALTPEQVAQLCPRLPEVQAITNKGALELAPLRPTMTASQWGVALHTYLKRKFDALKEAFPEAYANVFPELSISPPDPDGRYAGDARYGAKDTVRLDVVEVVNPNLACDYDIKSGRARLDMKRVQELAGRTGLWLPGAVVIVIEVRAGE